MCSSRTTGFWLVQLVFVSALGWSATQGSLLPGMKVDQRRAVRSSGTVVPVPRDRALHIEPLYDDPQVVSDQELADVLWKVLPRFSAQNMKPNFVEHSLRIWGVDAKFKEPGVNSGAELRDFLTDHGKYLASWGSSVAPLLIDEPGGVRIRWGDGQDSSVHHDHWLACLTEAGVPLDQPIHTPSQQLKTINDALQQALRDYQVDEREVEWSPLAFGLWIAPVNAWQTAEGREVTFDLMCRRLMRGSKWGVCAGTHRVYSLAAMLRLDDEHHLLSPEVRQEVWMHLTKVRDQIRDSQFADGHWPSNWAEGAGAITNKIDEPTYKQVIATGHHLEWLSIAPKELHPPHAQILKAARWCIATIGKETPETTQNFYTFYSHVGGALANWRHVHPATFYSKWEATHPPRATPKTIIKPTESTPK